MPKNSVINFSIDDFFPGGDWYVSDDPPEMFNYWVTGYMYNMIPVYYYTYYAQVGGLTDAAYFMFPWRITNACMCQGSYYRYYSLSGAISFSGNANNPGGNIAGDLVGTWAVWGDIYTNRYYPAYYAYYNRLVTPAVYKYTAAYYKNVLHYRYYTV